MDYKMIGIRRSGDHWKSLLLYTIRPWKRKPAIIVRQYREMTVMIGNDLDRIKELLADSGVKQIEVFRFKEKDRGVPIQISDIFVDHVGYIQIGEPLEDEVFKGLRVSFWVVLEEKGDYILR